MLYSREAGKVCLATEEFTGEHTEQVWVISAFLEQTMCGARRGLLCMLRIGSQFRGTIAELRESCVMT